MDNILLKFIVGLILTIYITRFLKENIKDPRPLGAKNCSRKNIDDKYMGFPSAHTSLLTYIFIFIAIHSGKPEMVWLAILFSLSVGCWRVWIKCHYVKQVLAGFLLGGGIALLVK